MNSKNHINKQVSVISLIIIVIVTMFSYLQYINYKYTMNRYDELLESSKQTETNYIKSIFSEEIKFTNDIMEIKSKNIQDSLIEEYGYDLNGLKYDIDNPSTDSKLTKVFDEEFEDFYINKDSKTNKPFVLSEQSLLWGRSLSYDNAKNDYISINELIELQNNNKLNETSIKCILNNNLSKYVFWQNEMGEPSSLTSMDIDKLIDIYYNEGLESMKNYELLIPTYITSDGDIFGNKDTDGIGHKVLNYKIIIIQRINIYDILKDYTYELSYFDSQNKTIERNENDNIAQKYRGISLMIAIAVIIIVLFGSAYLQNRKFK